MQRHYSSDDYVLLDACCLINLASSGSIEAIIKAWPCRIAVADYVLSDEALWYYSGAQPEIKSETSDVASAVKSLIENELLQIADLASESEEITFVNLAAILDDGEAISGSIAIHRGWILATDDRLTIRHLGQAYPQVSLITTPDMVKQWVDTDNPLPELSSSTLWNIQNRAQFEPPNKHPLSPWWKSVLAQGRNQQ